MAARNPTSGPSNPASWLAPLPFLLCVAMPCASLAEPVAALGSATHAATFAAPAEGMPLVRVLLALALVLGAVFAAAKLSRRMGVAGSTASARLDVLAQVALGARERAVLLRVGEREVLVGVATGSVRLLLELPRDAAPDGTAPGAEAGATAAPSQGPARPNFRDLLMRSLGR